MNEAELIESCLIEFAGWKWWAFPWDEVIVRSFRRPEFPYENWQAWAKMRGIEIVPATGDEPLMPVCRQSEIMPPALAVVDLVEREIAERGLQCEYAGHLVDASGGTNISNMARIIWKVATASPESRMRAALIAIGKES